jgi:signal transduction histidine kinase/CheY-like chemotaxis protein
MKWVYEQGTPIRDAEGHVKFLEGLIIDITPRKAIEQELVAARRKAEDALRVKARFLAVMSHEIRTPLNGILGLSDMLLGNAADPEKARELRMIQESGRHLLHIINDILEFSHMDSGKVQLEVQAFLLTSLVENLHRTFAPLARQKGLSFSLEVDASIPERFLGDENRLRQVMTNLIANSIKFTERGSVQVRVEGVPGSVPEQWDLSFRVKDSGIGIPESHQEIIFDEFVQADSATHRKYGGSGLGLAISRQIVHAMQGRIELQSVPGQGSEFCVTLSLPLAPPESSAGSHTGPSLSSLTFSSKAYHILVVEDHFINREVAKAVLSKMGLRVSTAESGMEALDFLHSTRPDLILMDLEMPGMDGCETTRLIRGREREHGGQAPPIPILAMTAHDLPLFQERCKEAGMDDILPKPIDPCVLFPVLHRFLEFNSPTYCSTPEPP